MKKKSRKIALSVAAIAATVGLVALPAAPSQADTGWGWRVPPSSGGK